MKNIARQRARQLKRQIEKRLDGQILTPRLNRDAFIGNGPVLIDNRTSKSVQFGSAEINDYWCHLYESGKTREDRDGVVHLPV